MLITYEREKLANAIVFFAKNTNYCGITKLFKLLYFLDFVHFRQSGKTVTGLTYVTWPKGPAPNELWHEIRSGPKPDLAKMATFVEPDPTEDRHLTKIVPKSPFDAKYFTKREMRILEQLAEIYRDAKAQDMVEVTHLRGKPWDITMKRHGEKAPIDPMLALDGTDKDQLSREEILERLRDREDTRKAFS